MTGRNSQARQPAAVWKCDRCPSTFQRLNHLQRHEITHDSTKDHVCLFCDSTFGRRDVLRRHWKSCKTRIHDGHEIPEPGRGGKHKRACDSCAVLRKACNGNGDLPCSACTQREKECTYRRLVEEHLSLPPTQAPSNNTHAEDTSASSEPAWELGISTLYPSLKMVASRHRDRLSLPEDPSAN